MRERTSCCAPVPIDWRVMVHTPGRAPCRRFSGGQDAVVSQRERMCSADHGGQLSGLIVAALESTEPALNAARAFGLRSALTPQQFIRTPRLGTSSTRLIDH
jgi:hypothetical protein